MSSICLKAMSRISMIDINKVIRDSLSHLRAEVPQEIKEIFFIINLIEI